MIKMIEGRSVWEYNNMQTGEHVYRAVIIADTIAELTNRTRQGKNVFSFGSVAHVLETDKVYQLSSAGEWVETAKIMFTA